MSNSYDKREQSLVKKKKNLIKDGKDKNEHTKEEKNQKKTTTKHKLAWILSFLFLTCILGALAGYGMVTFTPKSKFIKAVSLQPPPIRQVLTNGNLDVIKYNLILNGKENSAKNLSLNGLSISYNAKIDFERKKMQIQIYVKNNQEKYPITVYLTNKQLILAAQGYFELYQINIPNEKKIKVPKYIYTTKEAEFNIEQIWTQLEKNINKDISPDKQSAIKELIYLTFKSIPSKYFTKTESEWLLLSFDRLGLQDIMSSVIKGIWDKEEVFARTIAELTANNNSKYYKDIEESVLAAQNQITIDQALKRTRQVWNNIDQVIKLNNISIGIKNEPPVYNNSFELDCSIETSKDFPNGGDVLLKGTNKITAVKEVNITIPVLNDQNSIHINNISL